MRVVSQVCLLLVLLTLAAKEAVQGRDCSSDTKLEVTFVLDASGSIGRDNYNIYLKRAVKGIIDKLIPGPSNVPSTNVRVACIWFNARAVLQWNLHNFNTKDQYFRQVDALPYTAGATATGDALNIARIIHNSDIRRRGVPHYVMLITDGEQTVGRYRDVNEARLLKEQGAIIFAIGVGKVKLQNLEAIASGPQYRLDVQDYESLSSQIGKLIEITCVTTPPPPPPTPKPTPKPTPSPCKPETKADIVFLLDASGSITRPIYESDLKPAVGDIINDLIPNDNNRNIRVACILFDTKARFQWGLTEASSKADLLSRVQKLPYASGLTATGDGLNLVLEKILPEKRPNVPLEVILITDGEQTTGTYKDSVEAKKLRDKGVVIFAIGVGLEVNQRKLQSEIASNPSYFAYKKDYSQLRADVKKIATTACEALQYGK